MPHHVRRCTYTMFGGFAVLILMGGALGCGAPDDAPGGIDRDTLTQRQRDSLTAETGLPGARGIRRAQDAADMLDARGRAADSLSGSR